MAADHYRHLRQHGDVSVLPTTFFFYDMHPGNEVALQAMMMETHMTAERDGVIERRLIKQGDRLLAKELLVV